MTKKTAVPAAVNYFIVDDLKVVLVFLTSKYDKQVISHAPHVHGHKYEL